MALQTSGQITLADIQTEFGGSNPIGINEYYGAAAGVPTSGQITLADFYGTSSVIYLDVTYGSSANTTSNANVSISASTLSSAPCAIVGFYGTEDASTMYHSSMTIGGVSATSFTTNSDNTNSEHAGVSGGYRTYASNATGQTISVSTTLSPDKAAVAYYAVSGTSDFTTVTTQTYQDYADNTSYSTSVKAGDVVFATGSTRSAHMTASGMTLAAQVSIDNNGNWLDLYYKEITADGTFSTTLNRSGAVQQYSAMIIVLRPTANN